MIPDLDALLAEGVSGQTVLVRADLNVPLRDGAVADDTRVRASAPTLRRLIAAGARIALCSHLGRPKGKTNATLSLRTVAPVLGEVVGAPVHFAEDCVGERAQRALEAARPGEVVLLENLRFHPGETENDDGFADALASLAEVYVNDAFGSAHRAHASTAGVPARVPRKAAGDLLLAELQHLQRIVDPEPPFLCLLGGAKVSDKLGVLEAMVERADAVPVGGAMAYTFLRAQGLAVGKSLVEEERLDDARRIAEKAAAAGHRLLLPIDHVTVERIDAEAERRVGPEIEPGWLGVDIGPESAKRFSDEAARARTIFWNGPMGIFEIPPFASGTETVARAVAASTAYSVVGGGDSLAAVNRTGVGDEIDHLSTGGGASLEYVEGRELPGVAALEQC